MTAGVGPKTEFLGRLNPARQSAARFAVDVYYIRITTRQKSVLASMIWMKTTPSTPMT